LYSSSPHDCQSKELPLARNYLVPSKVFFFWNRCLVSVTTKLSVQGKRQKLIGLFPVTHQKIE
jgi:hypothetical protein